MKVLIACEESQRVCCAFREKGHEAYSCDILEPSGGHPEWHIHGDVLQVIGGGTVVTMDGVNHEIGKWDLMIAHPPCQKLCCAGGVNLGRKNSRTATPEWREKFFKDRTDAAIFFMALLAADVPRIAVENPVGYMNTHYRKPDQIIEPYMFGDPWKKATCLWLKGLAPLTPTNIVTPAGKWVQQNKMGQPARSEAWGVVGTRDAKERARTFFGIARAMADQWG